MQPTHTPRGAMQALSCYLCFAIVLLTACSSARTQDSIAAGAAAPTTASSLANQLAGIDALEGSLTPVRDPSIARQGNTWYLFSTDAGDPTRLGFVPIRCSADQQTWQVCGHVFATLPAWIHDAVPHAAGLWAPDISYFGGEWHLYYAASSLLSQRSAIGVATSPTLDPAAPGYGWTDHGMVISSAPGDDFNAIDPNIILDANGAPWLNYGSFWSGIKQQPVDAASGKLVPGAARAQLAGSPYTSDHAIEAASEISHDGFYYLFASTGHCCAASFAGDDYQEIVGRSTSIHGPFLDQAGVDLMLGGGTVMLSGGTRWVAPGSATAWTDAATGHSMLVFHALDRTSNGDATLWMQQITWLGDWPVLVPVTDAP
ncbi:arabinan endo-1,5-alpha-L-arabinosidase [Acidipila sp. EB88]|uniref:arabinan endo-1,5-alpha-L-arabinosidase n=1 Tax=Acidipila sp. EB88 TaxID=2305226 RepID=UPI00131529D8|nr:arabinan endo-1,5-alpha-L-arabinosidase [Acidipila sp. EB88]